MDQATASAPASIGNVGVGFDVLGLAFDAARDVVTAHREAEPGVRLGAVSGLVTSLPTVVEDNTALTAAASLVKAVGAPFGVRLDVHKGVPMSAGMGGSAASAVAAAMAVNALLPEPLPLAGLLEHGLEGERVSADPPPWDNVMAALFGGLVIAAREEYDCVFPLAAPEGIETILFHPNVKVETSAARKMLAAEVPFKTAVEHSRRIAGFVAGCANGDLNLIRLGFEDILVEPQRAGNLPALGAVQAAAKGAGALGCSFSGSGPSVFAWAETGKADAVFAAMAAAFAAEGVPANGYRAPASSSGARIENDVTERNAA